MDAVVIGSIITVVGSVIVLGYLIFKIKQLMDKDAQDKK